MQLQKISIPTPWKVNGYSKGVGVSKAKILQRQYGAELEFPKGWRVGFKLENLPWEGYGYFLEEHSQDNCVSNNILVCDWLSANGNIFPVLSPSGHQPSPMELFHAILTY